MFTNIFSEQEVFIGFSDIHVNVTMHAATHSFTVYKIILTDMQVTAGVYEHLPSVIR